MFVTWKVSDIIETAEIVLLILCVITFGTITWPIAGVFSMIWLHESTTKTFDNLYKRLPYSEQKEMGQLHHCKVYEEQCRYYTDERGYVCDTK